MCVQLLLVIQQKVTQDTYRPIGRGQNASPQTTKKGLIFASCHIMLDEDLKINKTGKAKV